MGFIEEYEEFAYEVRIVHNPGEDGEKIQDIVMAAIQEDEIRFSPTIDIEDGDFIYVTDSRISGIYKEPLIVYDLVTLLDPDPSGNNLTHKKAKFMPVSKWKKQQEESRWPTQQINVGGSVSTLAGRDYTENITNYNINAIILLGALEKAIEESEEIPSEEKRPLLEKVREIANNDYVKSISTGVIAAGLKSQLGF